MKLPGPTLTITPVNSVGRLDARIAKDLWLDAQGVKLVSSEARLTTIADTGRAMTLWADPVRTASELRLQVLTDGAAYARLDRDLRAMAKFAARLAAAAPPDVEKLRASDLRTAMGLFVGYRGMGSRLAHDFLRVLPMAVGDVVADGGGGVEEHGGHNRPPVSMVSTGRSAGSSSHSSHSSSQSPLQFRSPQSTHQSSRSSAGAVWQPGRLVQ